MKLTRLKSLATEQGQDSKEKKESANSNEKKGFV